MKTSPQPRQVLSSCFGRIKHLLLVSPKHPFDANQGKVPIQPNPSTGWKDLITQIAHSHNDEPTQFSILYNKKLNQGILGFDSLKEMIINIYGEVNEANCIPPQIIGINPDLDAKRILREIRDLIGLPISLLVDPNEIYPWIQDPFLVLRTSYGEPIILEPYFSWYDRSEKINGERLWFSKYIPEILSSHLDLYIKQTPCLFQGGNVLIGEDFALMGKDILRENLRSFVRWKGEPSELIAQLKKDLGIEKVLFPEVALDEFELYNLERQPDLFYHLDVFVNLCGKNKSKNIIMVGELYEWDDLSLEWRPSRSKRCKTHRRYLKDFVKSLENQSEVEFDVFRIPLPIYKGKLFSYNNCIVEVFRKNNRVCKNAYIPSYQESEEKMGRVRFKDLEKKVEAIWRGIGFDCHFINGGFQLFDEEGASLHCLTHILERDPY